MRGTSKLLPIVPLFAFGLAFSTFIGIASAVILVWPGSYISLPAGLLLAGVVALSAITGAVVGMWGRQQLRGLPAETPLPGRWAIKEAVDAKAVFESRHATRLLEATSTRTEVELREQILSSMSEGVLLVDPRGNTVYGNAAAERLLGADPALPAEAAHQGTSEFQVRFPQRRDLRALTTMLDQGLRLVVLSDVTESRRIEAMRRDFVADVSHELKTPVSGVLAAAETLEISVKEDPSSVPRFVDSLLREARRLSRLVEDLLDLARLEQQEVQDESVLLSDVVHFEASLIGTVAQEKGLTLEVSVEDGLSVRGNSQDIPLMVRNLMLNAVRYTETGSIMVRAKADDGWVSLTVSDTGVGIPAGDLPRVFERFYRVDRARSRDTGGTGLGLSIVKHVVERHGGTITATSELGGGSTFTVRLPATKS